MTGLSRNGAGARAPAVVPRICRRPPPGLGARLAFNAQWLSYGLLLLACLLLVFVHIRGGPGVIVSGPASVIDGDTLRVGPEEIRLRGIDAPEAAQANIAALSAMTAGQVVRCEGRERDHDGRLIGRCSTPDVPDIGGRLVSSGLARAFIKYSSDYAELERGPRNKKLGIWQSKTQSAWE